MEAFLRSLEATLGRRGAMLGSYGGISGPLGGILGHLTGFDGLPRPARSLGEPQGAAMAARAYPAIHGAPHQEESPCMRPGVSQRGGG